MNPTDTDGTTGWVAIGALYDELRWIRHWLPLESCVERIITVDIRPWSALCKLQKAAGQTIISAKFYSVLCCCWRSSPVTIKTFEQFSEHLNSIPEGTLHLELTNQPMMTWNTFVSIPGLHSRSRPLYRSNLILGLSQIDRSQKC